MCKEVKLSEKVLFADFANTDLVELKYNIDPWDSSTSSIEMVVHDRAGTFRKFKFNKVSNLTIEEGFTGYLGGTAIVANGHMLKSKFKTLSRTLVSTFWQ